jgi:putative transposase
VHLLLRTGKVPLATLMRRLLTGYAGSFNRRHRRHGQLFQNRYKSVLCQEDLYLMELTRYIHLNPLRAGVVDDLKSLDCHPYAGHSVIMGRRLLKFQDVDYILSRFGSRPKEAQKQYRAFVEKGIAQGRRPELTGGGLIRSAGGWKLAKTVLKGQQRLKGDERILGKSDFVSQVLGECDEQYERKYRLQAKGVDLGQLARYVAAIFQVEAKQVVNAGRYPQVVHARSVLCFWAVRELGITATDLARQMGLTQPAVSISVKRGEQIAMQKGLDIEAMK